MSDEETHRLESSREAWPRHTLEPGVLRIVAGPDAGRQIPFRPPSLRIGKDVENDLVLTDPSVSRHHLSIVQSTRGYAVRDLGSTNGTYLDGVRVQEAELRPGSRLTLGQSVLEILLPGESVGVPPAELERSGGLVGASRAMRSLFSLLERVAPSESTVLLRGETGTGKEEVARRIHELSVRSKGPFLVFDSAAVAPEQVESTLFGHARGAFTGAAGDRDGVFRAAQGGTVFLDEIGELPLTLQPRLLRVLELREVTPLGRDRPLPVDVRFVAATNRDLQAMVREGSFRRDLLYRLAVFDVVLPSLRERPEDIPLLTRELLARLGHPGKAVDADAMADLVSRPWAGNIRELRNTLERAAVLAGPGPIRAADLGPALPATEDVPGGGSIDQAEESAIRAALERVGGNRTHAARILGINRSTLQAKIKKFGIEP